MLRQPDFLEALARLLATPVDGLDDDARRAAARALLDALDRAPARPAVEIVPFVAGRRPSDEAFHPGLGSSDNAALVLGAETDTNRAVILYRVGGLPPDTDGLALDATLTLPAADGRERPLPGWHRRPIEPHAHRPGDPTRLDPVPLAAAPGRTLAFAFSPDRTLTPGPEWRWTELDPALRADATEDGDLFTVGHRLHQRLRVELRLTCHGAPLAAAGATLDVCDVRRLGALYRRVLDRVVRPDAAAQAAAAAAPDVDAAHHPWYPVLLIGADKAALYTRALVEDIAHKQRHLTDPAWLMRVGLYLELLTCVGIFDAVAPDLGDLLTPAERAALTTHPAYEAIRARVDVAAWREVWALRPIHFPRWSTPRMGPVSALNLLAKKRATLAFLEAHHADLEHAIALAGPNTHNAQETWHRVFRDAERAVLRKTPEAFPELTHASEAIRDFVLWHRRGRLDLPGLRHLPAAITALFGDQDGLYAAACNQYRASMNAVATHARAHDRMGWSGPECVPIEASLFEAHMAGNTARFARLQRRDGYAPTLEVEALVPEPFIAAIEDIEHLLAGVTLFALLDAEERRDLAARVRPIRLGPIERILIQGASGSSLFIVADGELEVLWRRDDGLDLPVGHLTRGSVFGEMALLTGAPRSATVRSVEHATLYEVCRDHLTPILTRRPALVDELGELITRREQATRDADADHPARSRRWHTIIRELFLGG